MVISIPVVRHAELVSASIPQPETTAGAEEWTLKQVQGDEGGGGARRPRRIKNQAAALTVA
jgi:hypothetical protein